MFFTAKKNILSCDPFHLARTILWETMIKLNCGILELVRKKLSGDALMRLCCISRESGF